MFDEGDEFKSIIIETSSVSPDFGRYYTIQERTCLESEGDGSMVSKAYSVNFAKCAPRFMRSFVLARIEASQQIACETLLSVLHKHADNARLNGLI